MQVRQRAETILQCLLFKINPREHAWETLCSPINFNDLPISSLWHLHLKVLENNPESLLTGNFSRLTILPGIRPHWHRTDLAQLTLERKRHLYG